MWFLWPVPLFLAAAALLVALLLGGQRLLRMTVTSQRAFWCPFRSAMSA
jgi:hypothetical protein